MRRFKKGEITEPGIYEIKIYLSRNDPSFYEKEIIEVFETYPIDSNPAQMSKSERRKVRELALSIDGGITSLYYGEDYDEYRKIGR